MNRADFINRSAAKIREVELPDGSKIHVRALRAESADLFEQSNKNSEKLINTVIAAAVDENGQPLFTEEDRKVLAEADAGFILAIVKAVNPDTKDDILKNSEATLAAVSASA